MRKETPTLFLSGEIEILSLLSSSSSGIENVPPFVSKG